MQVPFPLLSSSRAILFFSFSQLIALILRLGNDKTRNRVNEPSCVFLVPSSADLLSLSRLNLSPHELARAFPFSKERTLSLSSRLITSESRLFFTVFTTLLMLDTFLSIPRTIIYSMTANASSHPLAPRLPVLISVLILLIVLPDRAIMFKEPRSTLYSIRSTMVSSCS